MSIYVIAEPCMGTKDAACIAVCPADCIHPRKDEDSHQVAEQMYINPAECIGCGLCVAECPVKAIFKDDDLPPEWRHYLEKNARHFAGAAT